MKQTLVLCERNFSLKVLFSHWSQNLLIIFWSLPRSAGSEASTLETGQSGHSFLQKHSYIRPPEVLGRDSAAEILLLLLPGGGSRCSPCLGSTYVGRLKETSPQAIPVSLQGQSSLCGSQDQVKAPCPEHQQSNGWDLQHLWFSFEKQSEISSTFAYGNNRAFDR